MTQPTNGFFSHFSTFFNRISDQVQKDVQSIQERTTPATKKEEDIEQSKQDVSIESPKVSEQEQTPQQLSKIFLNDIHAASVQQKVQEEAKELPQKDSYSAEISEEKQIVLSSKLEAEPEATTHEKLQDTQNAQDNIDESDSSSDEEKEILDSRVQEKGQEVGYEECIEHTPDQVYGEEKHEGNVASQKKEKLHKKEKKELKKARHKERKKMKKAKKKLEKKLKKESERAKGK